MKYLFVIIAVVGVFSSCKEPVKKESIDPTGTWRSRVPWDNNDITVKVRPDSMILFNCKKLFCPGTKYLIGVGKWHMEKDSILVMEQYADGRKYKVYELFPELANIGSDTVNIIPLTMEARFIVTKDNLFDIETNGTRSKTKVYVRK